MTLIDDGSRFVPWSQDILLGLEHVHRYRWAQGFVANKRVLDIACGEGYGSALLAQAARHVTSVDLDLTALRHASTRYVLPNVTFVQANAEKFALAPHSIDVAVCFETLEHLSAHDDLLATLKSCLTDKGVLLISTPNKQVYTDKSDFHNPHHVRELYRDEFEALLKRYFAHVNISGQSVVVGSVLSGNQDGVFLHDTQPLETAIFEQISDQRIVAADATLAPRYFVACCSQQPMPQAAATLLIANQPSAHDALNALTEALRESTDYARRIEGTLDTMKAAELNAREYIGQHLQKFNEATAYARLLEERNVALTKTYEDAVSYARTLELGVSGIQARYNELEKAHNDAAAYARELENRIVDFENRHAHLHKTYTDAVEYTRGLEIQLDTLTNGEPELKLTYEDAAAYARSLETKIHDLEENLRQFTDIRK